MPERTIEEQIADLDARVARLESPSTNSMIPPFINQMARSLDQRIEEYELDPKMQPIGQLQASALIRYKGTSWGWSEDKTTLEDVLAVNPEALARGISALAHPVRISLGIALLGGPRESADLLESAGLNTTGQLYHHLQAMADAGLVERRGRNLWAHQNLEAFVLLAWAGQMLAKWRGPDDDGDDA